ncbi:MAG TPA: hypothetical protein VJA16_13165 [Thermoanaerobaculia bacterium]
MKKSPKKLTLHRDTLHQLSGPALQEAVGEKGSFQVTCVGSCAGTCLTCTCPTLCGQWYC